MTVTFANSFAENINTVWIRGSDALKFDFPTRYFCLGIVGAGKSSFLESLGECYLQNGAAVLDFFRIKAGGRNLLAAL